MGVMPQFKGHEDHRRGFFGGPSQMGAEGSGREQEGGYRNPGAIMTLSIQQEVIAGKKATGPYCSR